MKTHLGGLHHVTAIASDPQRNLDFYAGTLGMRFIKRTINFDDPGSYHFYFGDGSGSPGTILTFFPWPHARRGQRGTGEVDATAFRIPVGSVDFWLERLKSQQVAVERGPARFGEDVIRLADPDGMSLELIPIASAAENSPWPDGPVPVEHALRGFHSVSASLRETELTERLLTEGLGYQRLGETDGRIRLVASESPGPGNTIDLVARPQGSQARQSAGSVHHIAFRASSDDEQIAWRERLRGLGYGVSEVMDRTYFHSIYFREPGGVLFEIATDGPGFTADEAAADLGSRLCLPPWLEEARGEIESSLPKIHVPTTAEA